MIKNTGIREGCVGCLKELGADTKVKVLTTLIESKNKPKTVGEFVKILKLRQPTVSFHLKALKDAGLLVSERQGRQVFYSLSEECGKNHQPCFLIK